MKKLQFIFEAGDHKWAIVARDPQKPNYIIDTNEYLVISADEMMLMDPGGMEIFPAVFSAISEHLDPAQITALFGSHQDPDIISSLQLWLDFKPELKCYMSWLWTGFIPHFGGNSTTFHPLPDEGMQITFGNIQLQFVPAHYLHSSGNFHVYDPKARILFSGDIGAALLPHDQTDMYVRDFSTHIKHAEKFHTRWMGSNSAKNNWCERVSKMDIDMLCPQHGAIYQGEDVKRFVDWLYDLKVGIV